MNPPSPVLALFLTSALTTPAAQDRTDVPSGALLKRAHELVEVVYEKELAAASSFEEQALLAERMIERSRQEYEDMAFAYALLQSAKNLALTAQREDTALAAIDELTHSFRVDDAQTRIDIVKSLMETASSSFQYRSYFAFALASFNRFRHRDDWAAAQRLLTLLEELAPKTEDPADERRVTRLQKNLAELEKEYPSYLEATDDLQRPEPRSESYLSAGRYLALLRGEWEQGLPLLALSKAPDVSDAAALEMRIPSSAEERLQLADRWWTIAEKESLGARSAVEAHAEHWYHKTLPDLSGRERKRVEARLLELNPVPALPGDADPVALDQEDWRVRCWIDHRWQSFPLERATARVRSGVLQVRNTTGVYAFVRLAYSGRFLDGDFLLWFDFAGQPREVVLVPDGERDRTIWTTLRPGRNWRRAIVQRRGGELRTWIDGLPGALGFHNADQHMPGYFGFTVDDGDDVQVRNLHVLGGRPR